MGYILENVPPLGHVGPQIQEDAQVVCRHLGSPVLVDAAALGSYVHRLRWKWTNLASTQGISATLQQLVRPTTRDAVEWLVGEELQGQRVLAALAQEVGTKDAKETFKQVFFKKDSPFFASGEESMYGLAGVADGGTLIGGGRDTRALGIPVGGIDASPSA